jgi:hypothetical protein
MKSFVDCHRNSHIIHLAHVAPDPLIEWSVTVILQQVINDNFKAQVAA